MVDAEVCGLFLMLGDLLFSPREHRPITGIQGAPLGGWKLESNDPFTLKWGRQGS